MQYRKDINGLRAIAVIAVVLFHFNASWMPGGFAGVDVFFVISGFLMTGIIFRGFEQDNFSVLDFYVARANRVIPALAVLCLVLCVFGWFYLTPLDYRELGKHAGSSIGFFSNLIYYREVGYFDAASREKWLLHTWSLSVEWQFYITYPLVLVVLKKSMSLNAMKATVLAGTVLGFIFCILATYQWPNPAYYLLPTRAWEMMIGGVAYLYPINLAENRKKIFEWCGLTLIVLSCIFLSKEDLWPGYLALTPVLGAFVLIQAQRNDSVIIGNIVFQSLGKWSYSIYLWHWPLVVCVHYFSLDNQFIYLGLLLSVIFGFLSHKYIEAINLNGGYYKAVDYLKCKPIYMVFLVGVISFYIYTNDGLENRTWVKDFGYSQEVKQQLVGSLWEYTNNTQCLNDHNFDRYEELPYWFCMKNTPKDPTILLLGNSFANQLYPGFVANKKLNRHTVLSIGTCGFAEKADINLSSPCYGELFKQQKRLINGIIEGNESLEYIIIDGLVENQDKESIDRVLSRIEEINSLRNDVEIIVFYPHLKIPFHPANCYRRSIFGGRVDCSFNDELMEATNLAFSPLIKELKNQDLNISFFNQNVMFCDEKNKCSYIKNGLPLYRDSSPHTSEYASIILQNYFIEWLVLNNIDMF